MESKLSKYCDGLIEAGWIAAVIITPILFNIISSRIFEPDKISVLRSLTLLMLGAWIIKLFDQGGFAIKKTWTSVKSIPLLLPILLLALVYIVSSILSISPRISFLGSYVRLQGTYTFFSYLIIFISLVGNLQRREQLERLFTTIFLTSLPVALYGILQRYGLDPIPWGGNVQNRIAANMGNSIFLAAYLIMVVPVGIGKIILIFQKILNEDNHVVRHIIRATIYIFILLIDLVAIYMSGSRGPVLGLLTGIFLLVILLSIYWQKRWILFLALITAGMVGVGLLLLNVPGGPFAGLRESPWLGRFGKLVDMEQRTSQVRSLIWQGAADLVSIHPPIEFPDEREDPFNFLRPLIGYGPESMYVAYNRYYPPELAQIEKRNASPDRSHNESWDALITTGVIGFVVYQMVFIQIFYFGFKWLGLLLTHRQKYVYYFVVITSGFLWGVVFSVWLGTGFLGVGIPFGLIFGLIGYLTLMAITNREIWQIKSQNGPGLLFLVILLAVIIAHYVEIHFGIAIVATRTLFWIAIGIFISMGTRLSGDSGILTNDQSEPQVNQSISTEAAAKDQRGRQRRIAKPWVGDNSMLSVIVIQSLITALVLATLGYNYITNANRASSIQQILFDSFTSLPGEVKTTSYGIIGLLLITWVVFVVIFSLEYTGWKSDKQAWLAFGLSLAISLGISALFWVWQAGAYARIFSIEAKTAADVLRQITNYTSLITWYFLFILFLILGMSRLLPTGWPLKPAFNRSYSPLVSVAIVLFTGYLSVSTNLRGVQADITFKLADPFVSSQQWPGAIYIYQEAIRRAPSQDHYYLFLGRAYLEYARTIDSETERNNIMVQAEKDLLNAQALNPLNTDHTANLARLYSWRSSVNSAGATDDLRLAKEYYETALNLSPNNAALWTELAILKLNALGDQEGARQAAEFANQLDPSYDRAYAVLGDYYAQMAQQAVSQSEKTDHLIAAADQYTSAVNSVSTTPTNYPTLYSYYVALGNVQYELNKLTEAAMSYSSAYQFASTSNRWRVAETIAQIYYEARLAPQALEWVQNALQEAPEDASDRINQLLAVIEKLP